MRRKILYFVTFILLVAFYTALPTSVKAVAQFEHDELDLSSVSSAVRASTARITTRYIDVVSRVEIASSTSKVYSVGDTYTTSPISINGYKLEVTPSNATGKVIQSPLTVTYEYRKQLTVTTKYVDKVTGIQITSTSETYPQGAFYKTEKKDIPGYQYVEDSKNTEGTVGNTNIEVTYSYKRNNCEVVTKYVDVVTGREITQSSSQTGLEGEAYSTNVAEVDRYTLEVIPSNNTGVFSQGQTVVTYKYRKKSYVTTVYKDIVNNQEIYARNVQDLKQGDSYQTETRFVAGYTQVSVTGETAGIVGAEDITITYNYKKNSAEVKTKYIDTVTRREIAQGNTQTGLEGEPYQTFPEQIDKYVLEITPQNANGNFSTSEIEVVYEYRKQLDVTTRYVDAVSGQDIETPTVVQILEEGIYRTDGTKTFPGYTQTGDSGNCSGTVGPNDIVVVYYYKKNSNPVYTKFLDICSRESISQTLSQTGLEGEPYQTAPITIDGYVLEVTPENANGFFATEDINVEYEYRKQVNVITKFVDEVDEVDIVKPVEKTYLQEDEYVTEPMEFENYTLTGDSQNVTGTVGPDTITVTYYYKKNSAFVYTNYIDVCTKEPIPGVESKVQSGLESMPYTTEPIEIPGYVLEVIPENANGSFTTAEINVNYEYRKQSDVITKHVDANSGTEITDKEVVTYLEGDTYTTDAVDVKGYILTKTPDDATGTVGREDITVTYEYKKISEGIIVKYVDKVTNKILDTKYYDGNEKDGVDLLEENFDGYTLAQAPEQKHVEMGVEVQEYVFYYYKNVTVMVDGIDTDSRRVLWEYTIDGVENEEYHTEPREVPGYTLVKTPENAVVYYEYSKNILLGDVNLDGFINSTDAAYVLDKYKNEDANNQDLLYGDMNNDGILNSTDAAMILDIFKNS